MRWDPGHESDDLIDRRGEGPAHGGGGLGPLLGFLPLFFRGRFGWVGLLIVLALVFGGGLLRSLGLGGTAKGVAREGAAAQRDEMSAFVGFVLDDVQNTWQRKLASSESPYRRAKLVLFTEATNTGCGFGQAATGPFYCPADERVYIDLAFYKELSNRFGAKGDFAQAYVIAHEIGHHVQHQLGYDKRVTRRDREGAGGAAVRLELQADCFAGIWAHSSAERDLIEAGDLEEALRAASVIGDDHLQKQSGRRVQPESWTHGSSEQRARWLRRGYESGRIEDCDTFSARDL